MNYKTLAAIIAILIIEVTAILKGIDGALLGLAITTIAGLGGYAIGKAKKP